MSRTLSLSGVRGTAVRMSVAFGCIIGVGCSDERNEPAGTGGATFVGGVGAGTGKTTANGRVDTRPLCEQFCEATGHCFEDCSTVCNSFRAPPCQAEGDKVVECFIEQYDSSTCSTPTEGCDIRALLMCQAANPPECEPETCVGSDTVCSCTRQCTTGEQKAMCQWTNGVVVCSCYLNAVKFLTLTSSEELFPEEFGLGCSLTMLGPCSIGFHSP